MAFITVIIPFYNTEEYLPECIKSLQNQTFKDFICIMVDDHSTDNSRKICEEVCKPDERFLVIHNEKNLGCPRSREVGLKYVTTDYVIFADSDDTMPVDAIEELVKVIKKTDAKIVVGGNRWTDFNDNERLRVSFIDTVEDPIKYYVQQRGEMNAKRAGVWAVWAKAYKTSLFEDLIFPEFSHGEDQIINLQVCKKLKGSDFAFTKKCVYTHRDNPDSLMFYAAHQQNVRLKDFREYIWREWEKQWLMDNNLFEKYENDFMGNIYLIGLGRYLVQQNKIARDDLQYIRSVYKQYKSKVKLPKKFSLIFNLYYYIPNIAQKLNKLRKMLKKQNN